MLLATVATGSCVYHRPRFFQQEQRVSSNVCRHHQRHQQHQVIFQQHAVTLKISGGGIVSTARGKRLVTPKLAVKKRSKQATTDDASSSSILGSVFNLVNNVAGAGILTLSSGMASGTGFVTASIICAILGLLSGHCFAIVGEACELTKQSDFKGLWRTTIGSNTAWIVDAIIAVMCVACAIIYSGILGDVFTPLLSQAGVPAIYNGRTSNS